MDAAFNIGRAPADAPMNADNDFIAPRDAMTSGPDLTKERRERAYDQKRTRTIALAAARRKLAAAGNEITTKIDTAVQQGLTPDEIDKFVTDEINKQLTDQEPPLRGQTTTRPKKRKRNRNPDSNYSYRKKRKMKKDRKKRAPTKWVRALKEFNAGRNLFCIPKKGTEEYNQVLAIMYRM